MLAGFPVPRPDTTDLFRSQREVPDLRFPVFLLEPVLARHRVAGEGVYAGDLEEFVALPPLPAYIVCFRMLIIFDDCVNITDQCFPLYDL